MGILYLVTRSDSSLQFIIGPQTGVFCFLFLKKLDVFLAFAEEYICEWLRANKKFS